MNNALDFLVETEELSGGKSDLDVIEIKKKINEYIQILFQKIPSLEKYFFQFLKNKVLLTWENKPSGNLGKTGAVSQVDISINQERYDTSDGKTRASQLYLNKEIDLSTAIALTFIHEFYHVCDRFYGTQVSFKNPKIFEITTKIPQISAYAAEIRERIPEFFVELAISRNLDDKDGKINEIMLIMTNHIYEYPPYKPVKGNQS